MATKAPGRNLTRLLACALLLYGAAALATSRDLGSTGDQVRVIVDTSKSMCGPACGWAEPANDPGRLSILSTILLHDLLKPDPNKADNPDSFAVIPFDNQKWTGAQPPPSVDALENLDAIQRMSQPAPADGELLAVLQ